MNKNKIFQRIMTMALSVAMILGMLPVTAVAAMTTFTADISQGSVYVSSGKITYCDSEGSHEETYHVGNSIVITGSSEENTITVDGIDADITLDDVDIQLTKENKCAFALENGAAVKLTLEDDTTNTLQSVPRCAGISVPKDTSVIISGTGSLDASAIESDTIITSAAGIGGNENEDAGSITIKSGTVTATGANPSVGIGGGGESGNGGTVTISGGTVTAIGHGGIGIGGGCFTSEEGDCYITGGSVRVGSMGPTPHISANDNTQVYLTTVTLEGIDEKSEVSSLSVTYNSGTYSYGTDSMYTDKSGKIYLWLPKGAEVTGAEVGETSYSGSVTTTDDNKAAGTLAAGGGAGEDDNTAPTVDSVIPSGEDAAVSGDIKITFKEEMNTETVGTVSLTDGTDPVSLDGTWSDDKTVYIVPYSELANDTEYTITISGFEDAAGNEMTEDKIHTFTTKAAGDSSIWDGTTDKSWYEGHESDDSYTITNGKQLAGLAELVNGGNDFSGKTVKLDEDIVLNDVSNADNWGENTEGLNSWTPIGNDKAPFCGIFDGNGHTVSGIYIQVPNEYIQGLFGKIQNGTVQNLGVTKSYICGNAIIGGIVAICNGGTISKCYNEGTVRSTGASMYGSEVGGIAGDINSIDNDAKVENCYNTGNVIGSHACIGGIVGNPINGSSVVNCYNTGTLNYGSLTSFIGCIVGNSSVTVTDCYYDNTTSGYDDNIDGVQGKSTENMQTATPFNNWSTEVWIFEANKYPQLIKPESSGEDDTTAPAVDSVIPSGEDVAVSGDIKITFKEEMDTDTEGMVSLTGGTDPVNLTGGTWSDDKTVYTVSYSGLESDTSYTIKISGFKNVGGTDMEEDTSNTFKTVAADVFSYSSTPEKDVFYLRVKTSSPNEMFTVPVCGKIDSNYGLPYNWSINWGDRPDDGTFSGNSGREEGITHEYKNAGTYTITIKPNGEAANGWFRAFGFEYKHYSDKDKANKTENKNKLTGFAGCFDDSSIDFNKFSSYALSCMFGKCINLTAANIRINTDITNVGDAFASHMFYGCESLKSLPTEFNLPSGITGTVGGDFAKYMFYGCKSLETLPTEFNLPSGITGTVGGDFANYMFNGCKSLETLPTEFNLPSGITEVGINFAGGMFVGCESLETLPTKFNLPSGIIKVGNAFAQNMFFDCSKLTSLPDNFNLPSKIKETVGDKFANCMFSNCESLVTLPTGFNLPRGITAVKSDFANGMFNGCKSLEALPTGFNLPSKITGTVGGNFAFCMFYECESLGTLPTEFNLPSGITEVGINFAVGMFYRCESLKTLPTEFNLPSGITKTHNYFALNMFEGCTNLKINKKFKFPNLSQDELNTSGVFENAMSGITAEQYSGAAANILSNLTDSDDTGITKIYPSADKNTFSEAFNNDGSWNAIHANWKVENSKNESNTPTVGSVTLSGEDGAVSGNIVITFSEEMDTDTVGKVSLTDGTDEVSLGGTWSDDKTVYTVPYSELANDTEYTITISGFKDVAGKEMKKYTYTFTTKAAGGSSIWDGTTDKSWYEGHESDDSYTITNGKQLAGLAELVNGGNTFSDKTVKLGANIALNDVSNVSEWGTTAPKNTWTPIGNYDASFWGFFDGDGHTVSGIYINTDSNYQGLFGGIGCDSIVKNLGVTDSYIKGGNNVSGVVGFNWGMVQNCYNTGSVEGSGHVGGVAGNNYQGTVKNCYNMGSVQGSGDYVGGVAGANNDIVENCYNTGSVKGSNKIGGVVGYNNRTVKNCYNMGGVQGSGDYVGGVAGTNNGTVESCYNTGNVKDSNNTGGVVGNNTHTVTGCYYDKETCGDIGGINGADVEGQAVGKTTAEMKTSDTFSTWSRDIWILKDGEYPKLKIEGESGGEPGDETYTVGVSPTSKTFAEVEAGYSDQTAQEFTISNTGTGTITGLSATLSDESSFVISTELSSESIDPKGTATVSVRPKTGLSANTYTDTLTITGNNEVSLTASLSFKVTGSGSSIWDGTTDKSWYEGHESDDSYTITNGKQLAGLAELVNGGNTFSDKTVKLGEDIVLNDVSDADNWDENTKDLNNWIPIGLFIDENNIKLFSGTFDGDGHTVSGIYINTSSNYQGLFGYIGSNSTVKNVGVTDSYINGKDCVGGVVGISSDKSTIQNCYNMGSVNGSGSGMYVGGVIGHLAGSRSLVENCHNTGSVNGSDKKSVGGVAGDNEGTVKSCYNTGSVNGRVNAGGVAGANSGTVQNCYNTGSVNANNNVGGVVGRASKGTVENCYNMESVKGNQIIGGVAGFNGGTVKKCSNKGSVNGTSNSVGGVVGYNGGPIENCCNTGSVTGSSNNIGGVIGYNYSTVKNCYNTGSVKGSDDSVGGVVGCNSDGTVTSCYYNKKTSGVTGGITGADTDDAVGKSDAWMKNATSTDGIDDDRATFTDWDGKNVWIFEADKYPYFKPIVTDADAVAAAKAALKDGSVKVDSGATQVQKTAAVQTYVGNLLKEVSDAEGVTANVTYNSETQKYDVALSKGGESDSASLSMTVIDPDIATVEDAKTAAADAIYDPIKQADAANEDAVKAAVEKIAKEAVKGETVTVTVNNESYTAPIAGTSADPDGTDGSYSFTVTVTKNYQSATTETKTVTITATEFTDADAVAAAKAALTDGSVNVDFGATQEQKTAAVQTYVNNLLKKVSKAVDVIATVTYNSETKKYHVSLAKGDKRDSASLSMTVTEANDPDIKTVEDAKTAAAGATYSEIAQANAADEETVKAAVEKIAKEAVNDDTVTVTITDGSYTAPTAGTSADPDGTDGSYSFTVTVEKGNQSRTTDMITVTIKATVDENALTGKATITGDAVFGKTLTATLKDGNSAGTLSYQWTRDGQDISGATESTYTLTKDDVGAVIAVKISSDDKTGTRTSDATKKIAKVDCEGTASAPDVLERTDTTVTLVAKEGYEYGMYNKEKNTVVWQDSNTFTNLKDGMSYSFYQRIKETDTHKASDSSEAITVTTKNTMFYRWNYEGAVGDYTTQAADSDKKLTAPTTPQRAGYTFSGWYTDSSCKNPWNFKSSSVDQSMIFYAKWIAKSGDTFEVAYAGGGATSGKVPKGRSNYKSGDTVTVFGNKGNLSKSGASFAGWRDGTTIYKKGDTFSITDNTVLTAVWTEETTQCIVAFSNNYAEGGTYTTQTVTYGSLLTKPAAPTRDGYSFIGWYKNAACTNPWSFDLDTVTENMTLYTKWAQGTYSVSGTVVDDTTPPNKVDGATVKIMKGNIQFGDTVLTDSDGEFTVSGIPDGEYNVVITKNGKTVTLHIKVDGSDFTYEGQIILPKGNKNSKLNIIGSETPNIVEDGLHDLFKDSNIYDETSKKAVNNGGTAEIRLTVQKDNNAPEKETVSAQMSTDGYKSGIMLDVNIEKTVTETNGGISDQSQITSLEDALTLMIPLPEELQGKYNYMVYRTHDYGEPIGVKVDKITTTRNANNEYIEISGDKTYLTLHAKFFSTYAIGYKDKKKKSSSSSSATPTTQSYTITVKESDGGSISPSGSVSVEKGKDKTFTFTPKDGYIISDVLIDGKSVGAVDSYTFKNMDATHTIRVVFGEEKAEKAEGLPYYLDSKDKKVFIGFASDVSGTMEYIAPEGETIQFAQNPKDFNDISGHWAKSNIEFITQREIFVGTEPNTFSPNSGMTRAMFATVIGRLYERSYGKITATGNTFSDVPENVYYSTYVSWAEKNGVIKGVGGNKFDPNRKITRQEMAAILYRFAEFLKVSEGSSDTELEYVDIAKIDAWAIDSVKYCQENKIVIGRKDGSFAPQDTATRAEVATLLKNFVETVVK